MASKPRAGISRSGWARVVEPIDPTTLAPLTDRISVTPELVAALAPLVGMLLRSAAGDGGRLMLRTNLSTRPFYNVRAVQALLGGCCRLIVLVITVFNVVQLVRLTGEPAIAGRARRRRSEREAARLRTRRRRSARSRSRRNSSGRRQGRARSEHRSSISARSPGPSCSSQFEETLPADVRITAVQPRQAGRQMVVIGVEARRIDDLDKFIEALEKTGAFRDVIAAQRSADGERHPQRNDRGGLHAIGRAKETKP